MIIDLKTKDLINDVSFQIRKDLINQFPKLSIEQLDRIIVTILNNLLEYDNVEKAVQKYIQNNIE